MGGLRLEQLVTGVKNTRVLQYASGGSAFFQQPAGSAPLQSAERYGKPPASRTPTAPVEIEPFKVRRPETVPG
jgi:hypothetical protein